MVMRAVPRPRAATIRPRASRGATTATFELLTWGLISLVPPRTDKLSYIAPKYIIKYAKPFIQGRP
jgi:hypothetical protein